MRTKVSRDSEQTKQTEDGRRKTRVPFFDASHLTSYEPRLRPQSPFLFLYNLLLTTLTVPALPLVGTALLFRPRYRLGLSQRLGFLPQEVIPQEDGRQPFWLHAPSVGEILAIRPFLQALKQTFPDTPLLLSTLTPTAYVTAHNQIPEADAIIYLPLDHPFLIHRVLQRIKPISFFFTETEMWPNWLSAFTRKGAPTFLISGRFSVRASARYRLLGSLFRPIFQNLTLCCMQTGGDAERLLAAGARQERVVVTGNFKMDGVNEGSNQGQAILQAAGLAGRLLWIGASNDPGEEDVLLLAFRRLRAAVPNLLLLLAPRHPQRFAAVEAMLVKGGYRYLKRSQATQEHSHDVEVFLLDTLGELSSFYCCACITFVGGSL